jgi:hypothetical protein
MEENKYKSVFDKSNYNFINSNNIEINKNIIIFAEKTLPSNESRFEIANLIYDYKKADNIEKGIFEFSIIYIVINKLNENYLLPIYIDKLLSIKELINKNIITKLLNDDNFNLKKIAFMKKEEFNNFI